MSISTTNIPKTGNKVSKTLEPGNVTCKINSVSLRPFTYKEGGLEIVLNLESKDMGEGFEGFYIDNTNHSLGRHKGQVGRVKSSRWAYSDSTTPNGIAIKRDTEMMKFMESLCSAIGPVASQWLVDQDNKHETIESLFERFEKDKPFKDVYFNWCLAGKEYLNKEGYTNHELFLPKFTKTNVPFESANVTSSKLAAFSLTDHIVKRKEENVTSFDGGSTTSGSNDFDLSTEK